MGSCRTWPSSKARPVHKGDVLARIDPRPYQAAFDQATATKQKDVAQLANARRDLDRYLSLEPQHLASRQQIDTQKALVTQLEAQIQADAAAVDNARTQLSYTSITSPIDGRTGIRQVDPGNIVRAADATGIVVVTQVQPISVVFTLPEESLNDVNTALSAGAVQRGGAVARWQDRARSGHARAHRQRDRRHDRHGATQSHLPERSQHALAGRVRERASARPDGEGRADDSRDGASARRPGTVRLRREAGLHASRSDKC